MDFSKLSFIPTADRPLLVGILVDVSASMITSIQNSSGHSQNRLESFRDAFGSLANKGKALSQGHLSGAITPLVKVCAYGFGFGNPLSILFGGKGPNVRDLLSLDGKSSTISINDLSDNWPKYQSHLTQMVTQMFGDTPMLAGLKSITDRFKAELSQANYSSSPVLFILSDGDPTDAKPDEIAAAAEEVRDLGAIILSCYVTDHDIAESRHLYSRSQPNWPSGAQLMFRCASALPKESPFDASLREYKWEAEPEARLFTQLNQSEILSEFLNLVLSPLEGTQNIALPANPSPDKIDHSEALRPTVTTIEPPEATAESTDLPVHVFVSYCHQDADYLEPDSLLGYLSGLSREGLSFWHDKRISTGELWDDRILNEIQRADVALILVSHYFLNSKYCQEEEIANFLGARRKDGLVIFPIILSPCDWKSYKWLAGTQFIPRGGKTIETNYRTKGDRHALFYEILEELRETAKEVRTRRKKAAMRAIDGFFEEFKGQ